MPSELASPLPTSPTPRTAILVGLGPRLEAGGPPSALVPILGRSPLQRHLVRLAKLGVERAVLVPEEEERREFAPAALEAMEARCRRQRAEVECGEILLELRTELPPASGEGPRRLWLRTEGVYDPRLHDAVIAAGEAAVWVAEDEGGDLDPVGVALGPGESFPGPETGATPLPISTIPEHLPSLRRRLRPWGVRVRTPEAGERAGDRLIDATQKGILDFPARYFHPPFENAGTRLLAPTPVTPNQVTVVTGLLGFLATWLFAIGSWIPGLALAFVVNVLDGVDGKLARVKLMTSRFGDRLDHILDVVFEFSWYLGIGWGLSGGNLGAPPFRLAVGLILVMLGTRAMSGVYTLVSGRQIHDHRAFDRGFRLIAGRRNVFVTFLIVGLAAGAVEEAFRLCVAWAVVTLGVYTLRTPVELLLHGGAGGREGEADRAG